ncbi:hypothetical protein BN1723_017385, partial [Verticillium longisporum]
MWLSPRQIQIIPVGRGFFEYAEEVQKIFKDAGFWVDVDLSGETLQKKVRRAQLAQYNFVFNLAFETIEPKVEEEMRRKRMCEGDVLSDSSSSASDLPYPSRALMSSPLKAPLFSDAIGSSNGSTTRRKRTFNATFDYAPSSPSKRLRSSPTPSKSFHGHHGWKGNHQLAQSSPLKPRRQQHFT